MSVEQAQKRGLTPLGRIVNWGVAGVDPKLMGRGPVPAAKLALQRAGLTLDYIDLIEVNEAFAAQYLAVERELGLDRSKVNVNGGAIALGHPVGSTGGHAVGRTAAAEEKIWVGDGVYWWRARDCHGGGEPSVASFSMQALRHRESGAAILSLRCHGLGATDRVCSLERVWRSLSFSRSL